MLERLRKKLGLILPGSLSLEQMDEGLFLDLVHRLILNRPPDQGGLERFKENLESGVLDRRGVILSLLMSGEAAYWTGPPLPLRVAALEANLAARLRQAYPDLAAEPQGRDRLAVHEMKLHSQHGEDGIILHLLSEVGAPTRRFVEFGASDGRECCAANLALTFGWQGLFLERDQNLARSAAGHFAHCSGVRVEESLVTAENINGLISRAGLQGEIDLLSVDIDGNDYWVWRAIDAVNPRLVVIEYNASLGPDASLTVPYDPDIDRFAHHPSGLFHGASLAALAKLGNEKGYRLVGCDSSGVNAFFLRRDLGSHQFPAVSPAEAWYPDVERGRSIPPEEQAAIVAGLAFQEV